MKRSDLKRKTLALLLTAAMIVSLVPQLSTKAHAEDRANDIPKPTLPSKTEFAVADDLATFNTSKENNSVKLYFGPPSDDSTWDWLGRNYQQWWIAGSKKDWEGHLQSLTLYSANPLKADQPFSTAHSNYEAGVIEYYNLDEDLWDTTVYDAGVKENIKKVYKSHYGANSIRMRMWQLESYFTHHEKELMLPTRVYTKDTANKEVYYTEDRLYLGYGEQADDTITVGENRADNLKSGLSVVPAYWGERESWLRTTPTSSDEQHALTTRKKGAGDMPNPAVGPANVIEKKAVVPAFELDAVGRNEGGDEKDPLCICCQTGKRI